MFISYKIIGTRLELEKVYYVKNHYWKNLIIRINIRTLLIENIMSENNNVTVNSFTCH